MPHMFCSKRCSVTRNIFLGYYWLQIFYSKWNISCSLRYTWWRHQVETFSALLAICAGNSPVSGEFPAQRPVTQSFDIFFDLHLNKRLSKLSWGWWFETLSCPLWRHCNAIFHTYPDQGFTPHKNAALICQIKFVNYQRKISFIKSVKRSDDNSGC